MDPQNPIVLLSLAKALISQRRAQGHYRASRWPTVMFIGCALAVALAVLLLN